ncbi:MAG TPA: 1-acyl-sn-glycerol-3-phosphate acyltransferase [Candidatus Eisenbacteria bacterium]|nr:1-acyl-sn-glycerol-3-phosphate acyltransferase [Candidatus Eisenbacteria bacterium]
MGAAAFPMLRLPLSAALGIYFRKISFRDQANLPRSGAVLVVSNHPATLSETFLIGTRLGRRFHFIAASFVFKPWIKGALARFCGAIPVYRRQDEPEQMAKNADMFRECHAQFDRGQAIVIFPEGESLTDRAILPLKTGAARLALGYDALPGREGKLALVPVGVYYSDRTKFQSEAVVSVGQAIDLAPFRGAADSQEAVRDLTAAIQKHLESLILNVPNDAVARFVHDVEKLYLADLREEREGEPDLDLLRRIAECITYYQAHDPLRVYDGWRRTNAYWRKLETLGIADPALQSEVERRATRRHALALLIGGAFGLVPALLGMLVNLPPFLLSALLARLTAPQDILVSSIRIIAGLVVFPLTYGVITWALRAKVGWSWETITGALLLCALLGYFALVYLRWVRTERERIRVAFLSLNHRRLMAKLRAERKALVDTFDQARADYLAATRRG